MALWTVSNNIILRKLEEGKTLREPKTGENRSEQLQPIDLGVSSNASLQIISGDLPPGLRIIDQTIQGTPLEVARETEFKFVIRATENNEIDDRTLKIVVSGADVPIWKTPAGPLPIGNNDTFYILDSAPVDYQLIAEDTDIAAGQSLEYFIASGDGELPPGIELTRDGRIVGVIDPILALDKLSQNGFYDDSPFGQYPFDFGTRPANGYDSFYYDIAFYDKSVPTKSPKKLNRNYQFRVSVNDGDTIEKRLFRIFVVGDDFLRSDNTIMQTANGTFTADNTFVRTPIWLTPADLGYRRADNYVTLFLDTIDANNTLGFINYDIQDYNDDGTLSEVPPGLELDTGSGELAGRVPYQPSVTREYKFTVTATRYSGVDLRTPVTIEIYETTPAQSRIPASFMKPGLQYEIITANDTDYTLVGAANNDVGTVFTSLGGTNGTGLIKLASSPYTLKIKKNENLTLLDGVILNIKGTNYKIIGINSDNQSYDILTLSRPLESFLRQDLKFTQNILTSISPINSEKSSKTFTVRMLGKIDSTITWTSDSTLGSINANLTSIFRVEAQTSVPNAVLRYSLVSGRLPPGLNLALDGEVFGKVQQFGKGFYRSFWKQSRSYAPGDVVKVNNEKYTCLIQHTASPDFNTDLASGKWDEFNIFPVNGLLTLDQNDLTLDGDTTTLDKIYTFVARAEDQFGFSAITKTFTITVNDPNDLTFSNIVVKPFLNERQKFTYNSFISDPIIFNPSLVYRPNDTEFGVQNDLKMLVYAGIENVEMEKFVGAAAKNHKRKTFKFGAIRNAVAYQPGTRDTVYEVVYVEVIDPYDTTLGKVKNSINVKSDNKRLINDTDYELLNNSFSTTDVSPYRFRPITSSVKIDSDALNIDESKQQKKYISNLTNMRERIASVGNTDNNFLPLWMRTPQQNNIEALGFVPCVVLSYCKPGTSSELLLNIKNSDFNFSDINFEIDRYIIDSTKGNSDDQYILFANYDFNI
jgi:hypothetical protein